MAEIDVTIVIPPTSNTVVIDPNGAASAALSAITATNQAAAASEDASEAAASASAALSSQNAAAASAASISIGTPGGVATLDGSGHLTPSQMPESLHGGYAGYAAYNVNTTLTNAQANYAIQCYGPAETFTLPVGSTMVPGQIIAFYHDGTGVLSIATQGSDFIWDQSDRQPVAMQPGDRLTLLSRGGTEWDVVDGTAALQFVNGPRMTSPVVTGEMVINGTGSGVTNLNVSDPANGSGANILLSGNGATTPNKTIRAYSGRFQVLNSAYGNTILDMDDAGDANFAGNVVANGGVIYATSVGNRQVALSVTNFDGFSIDVANIGNTVKKPIALAPYGGTVFVGATADDGFGEKLQVTGNVSINRASGEGDLLLGQNDGYFFGNTVQAGWYSPTHGSWNYDFTQRNILIAGAFPVWHSGNTPTASPGDNSTALATTAFVTAAVAPFSGKNRAINGNCNIAQRAALAVPTGTAGYGGPDRFTTANEGSAGGQFTQSQGSITWNGVVKAAVVQTVNTVVSSLSSGSYWAGIAQAIEGYNCFDLLGKPVVISFIFQTNVTGVYTARLTDGGNANSYLTTFNATANVAQKVVVAVPTLSTSLSIPNSASVGLNLTVGALNQGTYQTSTLNAWQSGNFISANTATNWATTTNNYIALTELQLEAGTVATPFEERSAGTEMALCQRYYQTLSDFLVGGYQVSGGTVYGSYTLPVNMRAAPTTAVSGTPSYSNASGYAFDTAWADSGRLRIVITSTGYGIGYGAPLTFSAEL